jgi:hypothetical protein
MINLRKYFSQQYPQEENRWRITTFISLFIGLFMTIFQPFGLIALQSQYKLFILAGYGLVTFIILVIDLILIPAVFPNIFRDEKWTLFKELVFLIFILFTVGLANLFYSSRVMGFLLTVNNMLVFQAYTLVVGIIPITALTLIKHNYLKHKNEESARIISAQLSTRVQDKPAAGLVQISSDNGKEQVSLPVSELLFIKSEGNYITVGYLKNGRVATSLLRNTMKYAVDLLEPFQFIQQCHRSWLVNLSRITKVSGNSQGLRITIEGFEEDIPVARKSATGFRQQMASLK